MIIKNVGKWILYLNINFYKGLKINAYSFKNLLENQNKWAFYVKI